MIIVVIKMNKLLIYGFGYTAKYLSKKDAENNFQIIGTSRDKDRIDNDNKYINIINDSEVDQFLDSNKSKLTHVLITTPPSDKGDPFFLNFKNHLSKLDNLKWIGYLSATNVYGDHNGNYVNEESGTYPLTKKGKNRLRAEQQWKIISKQKDLPLHIFRLAGIYGPKRNFLERIKKGEIKNIFKEGQYFSRIYIDDLIKLLFISMMNPNEIITYNISDDMSSSSSEVIEFVCDLISIKCPEKILYESLDESFKSESFYSENKRINNALIKKQFGIKLDYPTFREGYKNILSNE